MANGTGAVEVAADLAAEQATLDMLVSRLEPEQWDLATPSPRWAITDQIGHLAYFDRTAALAITDPEAFQAHAAELGGSFSEPEEVDEATLGDFRRLDAEHRLAEWRAARGELAEAASTLADDDRVVWYGPSMGARSFLTARLMECWAHGVDVADTLGTSLAPTDRLRHVAQIGVITRKWTYLNRGEEAPAVDIRIELTGPSGDLWTWGGEDAPERVTGSAEDFCLVVTQRRNVADTALSIDGAAAVDWLAKAQAFAGPATDGPAPKTETP